MTAWAAVTRWLAVNAVLTVATAVLAYMLVGVAGALGLRGDFDTAEALRHRLGTARASRCATTR